jgi:heme/copper-type cytochrome/quinol oxidase subunit 3
MLFAGLVGAFLVLRLGSGTWPPPLQPRLPVEATGVNSLVLVLSGLTMAWSLRLLRRGDLTGFRRALGLTALLGLVFLGVQGYEWVRLVHFGLTLSTSTYGSTFYTIIGCHGAHVFIAVLWLLALLVRSRRGGASPLRLASAELCGMYWYYVVGLWPVLYGLVYLS